MGVESAGKPTVTAPPAPSPAPALTAADLPPLDLEAAFAALNPRFWKIGAQVFLEDAGADIERLGRAVTLQDSETARDLAHKLKGAAGNIRALRVRGLALALEEATGKAGVGDWPAAAELFSALEAAWRVTQPRIREQLDLQ